MTGQRYGRLLVLSQAGRQGSFVCWLCRCDCGVERVFCGNNLRRGLSTSCGCRKKEVSGARFSKMNLSHGQSFVGRVSEEYKIWANMLYRCRTESAPNFENYGGRGIKVCIRWETFESFFQDLGPRPSPEHSIDRRDNDLHYSCGKCRECVKRGWTRNVFWATRAEQAANRRTTILIEYKGKVQSISDWHKETGLSRRTIAGRYKKGLPPEQIFAPVARQT